MFYKRVLLKSLCYIIPHFLFTFSLFNLQIVFEHKVGVVDREGPTVYDMLLLSHPCQPAGSCDFEDGLCAYESKDWLHYCPDAGTSGQRAKGSLYPLVDHTYGVNTGKDSMQFS